MKLKVDRTILLKALAHIQSVAEKRNTIPILANVLIEVQNGLMTLTATDMEIAIVESIPAESLENGSVTAPASVLYEIVRKLPDTAQIELTHTSDDMPLSLRAGKYATSLNVLSVNEFPSMTSGEFPHQFNIPTETLKKLIEQTRFAISTEETRYYLNGIYLHIMETSEGEKKLCAVATDGHRLARVESIMPEGSENIPGIIIPRKTVYEAYKLLEEANDTIELSVSETRIQIKFGDITLTSKLIDGTFPEYERVIPKNNTKILRVSKKDFATAVARVAAISMERSKPVKLSLDNNSLILSASSVDQGNAKEELDDTQVQYDGGPLEIGFQARYLNDITDQIDSQVEFVLADNSAPTIVRDVDDMSALYVLMPMRV
ncbi:DNA polymerase III subunit beta [Commensalibacter intestini A911]|uniref:Beta sliding clamp n=2 Tax=Commensalibacter intestini TaxID=479936 RepID=A0A251ZXI1_9PROT|nr:DNA polymerase III subunit beta [Commensalibacter intestini]EHD14825.1 DNA polymerase III subunit beta [Commensalibacter intestini A911]OUI79361.1 DNA polymerase III subunit beta [Commensalibacter intestini]